MSDPVIIIGAGHAGGAAAFELRRAGFDGPITLIGGEAYPPYQRPPLSKAYLKGDAGADDLFLRGPDWYEDTNTKLILRTRIISIDPATHVVTTSDGTTHTYGHLILATGARCRTLDVPGANLPGVQTLRDFDDVSALKPHIGQGKHLVVVGGGFIGLEAAAVARQRGTAVTVIEREGRLMARTSSPEMSTFYHDLHTRHGVDIRYGVRSAAFTGTHAVDGVTLSDGRHIRADAVLIGIGVIPNVDLAVSAGIPADNGVLVDADGRTSNPHIFAIGDVANRSLGGHRVRLESVHNALEGAKLVAAAICGLPRPVLEIPWFWSDQYDVKLQIVGLISAGAELVVRTSAPASRTVFHLVDGRVQAVEAANDPAAFMAGKALIAKGIAVDAAQLADPGVPLKSLLTSAVS
jgi:3-phenylpropionate/trans-cinnamate dioxygenase ferredoxin reductase subunit